MRSRGNPTTRMQTGVPLQGRRNRSDLWGYIRFLFRGTSWWLCSINSYWRWGGIGFCCCCWPWSEEMAEAVLVQHWIYSTQSGNSGPCAIPDGFILGLSVSSFCGDSSGWHLRDPAPFRKGAQFAGQDDNESPVPPSGIQNRIVCAQISSLRVHTSHSQSQPDKEVIFSFPWLWDQAPTWQAHSSNIYYGNYELTGTIQRHL